MGANLTNYWVSPFLFHNNLHESFSTGSGNMISNCINHMFNLKQKPSIKASGSTIQMLASVLFILVMTGFLMMDADAQNIGGQWLGGFTSADNPEGGKTDFVLELDVKGTEISGYSYTYFSITGKRYYVICKLKGSFEKDSKEVTVKEIETVKTNTPRDFQNCLQQHQLTYFRKEDKEYLFGKWKPNQVNGNCGKGETQMERTVLKHFGPDKNIPANSIVKKDEKKAIDTKDPVPSNPAIARKPIITKPKLQEQPEALKTEPINNNFKPITNSKGTQPSDVKMGSMMSAKDREKLNERTSLVLKTIDVASPSFKVDIYDNGQIDGDTVTIFLNDKLLVHNQKLTASPISFEIKIDPDEDVYDLVMYAESMGTIPPNTAFMVVTTPTNRYEINITSTEQTSGAIRFKVKR